MTESNRQIFEMASEAKITLYQGKTFSKLAQYALGGKVALVSVSGGSDSDCVMDLVEQARCQFGALRPAVRYVFYDTGLEFDATRRHLDDLEQKYGVKIERHRPKKNKKPYSIVNCVKEYGVPFMSKIISRRLGLLFNNEKFDVQNPREFTSFEHLENEYGVPKWLAQYWYDVDNEGKPYTKSSQYALNKQLKDFFVTNGKPTFKISDKCCLFTKKNINKKLIKSEEVAINMTGVRYVEGGIRAEVYKSCFDVDDNIANYRPLFWWTNDDKLFYKRYRNIRYSDCYEVWGFERTGCVGCPINCNATKELEIAKQYEPYVVKAAYNIFGASYDLRRKYNEFRAELRRQQQIAASGCEQVTLWEEQLW